MHELRAPHCDHAARQDGIERRDRAARAVNDASKKNGNEPPSSPSDGLKAPSGRLQFLSSLDFQRHTGGTFRTRFPDTSWVRMLF
jgi:hypothetical protein